MERQDLIPAIVQDADSGAILMLAWMDGEALRLTRDLELDPAGVALALDLLDEIAVLRTRLQRAGIE